jgi:hypothetical protein
MRWTDGLNSDDGQVGAQAVCKHSDEWRYHRSYVGTGGMDVFDAELWAIGLVLHQQNAMRSGSHKQTSQTLR